MAHLLEWCANTPTIYHTFPSCALSLKQLRRWENRCRHNAFANRKAKVIKYIILGISWCCYKKALHIEWLKAEMYCLVVLEARVLKSRYQHHWLLPWGTPHGLPLAASGLLAIFDIPWLAAAELQPLHLLAHDILSVCLSSHGSLLIRTLDILD